MAASEKIHVIGIGDDGLDGVTAAARQRIERASLLFGSERTLSLVPTSKATRVVIGSNLEAVVDRLALHGAGPAVVLVSGDPLFYGISRFLAERIGKDRFEVLPHVSSMQLAFARVKESWDEAYLTDLANHALETVLERIRSAEKIGLFTSEAAPPKRVAAELLHKGIDYFTAYVCENLGSPDERVTQGELKELAAQDFAPLNVMILVRKPNVPDRAVEAIGHRLFGNADELFVQSRPKKGLLTPAEVRTLALAELDLGPRSIVWDVGAGSGAVAVEAAMIADQGTTFAIEMDPEDHALIVSNAERFGVRNLVPILGRAPEAWASLPPPDAVFVGGLGREIGRVVEQVLNSLKPGGRIVVNSGSIENLADIHAALQSKAGDAKVWMINLARGTFQFERIRFDALNPTFLVSAVKAGVVERTVEGETGRVGDKEIDTTPLDVIAVGAHPDDVEIACGGTLAKLVRQGYRVGILDLTDGEPTPNSPGPHVRLEEARRAAETLGVHVRRTLELPNRRLFDTFEARVALATEFRRYRPQVVIGFGEKTPLASPDHDQAMRLTEAAVFYARLTKWDEHFSGLPVHTIPALLYYTLNFGTLGIPPGAGHVVVDIAETLEKKIESIRCYATQFPPAKAHVFERVRAFALQQGQAAGFAAGELFATARVIGTRNLIDLLGLQPPPKTGPTDAPEAKPIG